MRLIQNDSLKQRFSAESHFEEQFSFPVLANTRLVFFPANSTLIHENAASPDLFYLVRGRTKLSHTLANGKTLITGFFTPPCFLGEMELIDPTSPAFAVQAIEDCWCLALTKAPIATQLLNDPVFLRHICIYLTHKDVSNLTQAARNQGFTAAQRLAAFILLTENHGQYHEQHTQVAQYLGISYRHLLYVIADFLRQGYLVKTPTGYRIHDRAALHRLAHDLAD